MVSLNFDNVCKTVQNHFESVITGFLRDDIKLMLALPKKESGSCAAPLAMTVLSGMNHIGQLIGERRIPLIETSKFIKIFCNEQMRRFDPIYIKGSFQELLIELFRNGLAHEILPKEAGITRAEGFKSVLSTKDGQYVLQADILAENFISCIEILHGKIKDSEKHKKLIERIYDNLSFKKLHAEKKIRKITASANKNLSLLDVKTISADAPTTYTV